MKWSILICIAVSLSSNVRANAQVLQQASKAIPLDQVWGYNLPGTKDISSIPLPEPDLQPGVVARTNEQLRRQREQNIEQMRRALMAKLPTEKSLPGFVMSHKPDFVALQRASMLATSRMHPDSPKRVFGSDAFRAGDDMTLVFYSHPASYYVRLREVKRENNEITVEYEFEPHVSPEVTVHFALIPLGELTVGEYQVRFKQIPLDQKFREAGFEPTEPNAPTIVCQSFSFKMLDLPSPDERTTGSVIPLDRIWGLEMTGTREINKLELEQPQSGPEETSYRRYLVQQISQALSWRDRPKVGERSGPAFVVVGTDMDALKNAASVFNKEKQPAKVFPTNTDLTLVFYSYECGRYVRLASVQQSKNLINVKYQLVAHPEMHYTTHFGLIPLGKLSAGDVEVKVEQVKSTDAYDQRVQPLSDPLRFVSGSFSFEVRP